MLPTIMKGDKEKMKKKGKEDYDFIFDHGDDSGINYSNLGGITYKKGDEDYEEEFKTGTEYHSIYDEVYDEEGAVVICDLCGSEMIWKNSQYICSGCGQVMERSVFFNYIGAEPPGSKCVICDNLYPGCVVCPYGYIEDDF